MFISLSSSKTNLITTEGELGIDPTGQTVLNLCFLPGAGHRLVLRQLFCCSLSPARAKKNGMSAACTLHANRVEKCPFKKELRKEGRWAMDYMVSEEGIMVAKWFDNKEVMVGSNHCSMKLTSQVKRWDKTKEVYVWLPIPTFIKAYNRGMGGVDCCPSTGRKAPQNIGKCMHTFIL
jgi:hypothetical protein